MGVVLFSLELIIDRFRGSAGTFATDGQRGFGTVRPALGVRLLNLAPVVIDCSDGETYVDEPEGGVAFGGKGKALTFELPWALLQEVCGGSHNASTANKEPLPLLLMALARPLPQGAELESPQSKTAVLLASACVDLRAEVVRAVASCVGGGADGCVGDFRTSLSSSKVDPFTRCSFNMTPVRDSKCALTVDCYVRLYLGGPRQLAAGELSNAVEPRVLIGAHPPRKKWQPPEKTSPSETTVLPSPEAAGHPGPRGGAPRAHVSQEGVFFPEEVFMRAAANVPEANAARAGRVPGHADDDRDTGGAEDVGDVGDAGGAENGWRDRGSDGLRASAASSFLHAAGTPARESDAPAVSGSLPLVSELLRELWQIRRVD